MKKKAIAILPLATALLPFSEQAQANAPIMDVSMPRQNSEATAASGKADIEFAAGKSLLGLKVFRAEDGTLMAGHSSHSSHASHASHASSRY